jgi:hypothetical protein
MSELIVGELPHPKMRKAALPGDPIRKENISKADHIDVAPDLQARRLISRFGLPYETAITVCGLAFAVLPR